jgi:predicted Holliday junction resolvase-like endonuclease
LTYKEKQIMDTLSFILGIAFVVVIAVAIVAVYAFVKVRNLDRELSSAHQVIETEINNQNRLRENDRRDYENVIQDIYRAIDNNRNERKEDLRDLASQMNRSIDSRFDIFTNKYFPSQEQLKK